MNDKTPSADAEAVVQRQFDAYNARDHERISGVRERPFEVAVVYEVVDGLIRCTWTYAAE